MSALDALLQQVDPVAVLDKLVPRLTVRTRYGPDLVFDAPFAPDAQADATSPIAWLKPAIDITLTPGGVRTIAPWGDPGATDWPTVKVVGIAAGAILLGLGAAWALGR